MNNSRVRKVAKDELISVLNSIGCVDGVGMTPEQIRLETRPIIWHNLVKSDIAKQKPLYVTYSIPSSTPIVRADNDVYLREILFAIDIFSKYSFDNRSNYDFVTQLETKLQENGFEVELNEEIYEEDTKLFHNPITIYKFY